jgi:amino-acid N-acetyltransferase
MKGRHILMTATNQIILRKATLSDVPEIFNLVNSYAQQELLLPRSLGVLYETIRDFVVAFDGDRLVGTGALHIIWDNLGEVRSLAVEPGVTKKGIGRQLLEFLKKEAIQLEVKDIFALTYKPEFFIKCGFMVVSKDIFPQKVWVDCVNCIKFPNCDEVAVKLILSEHSVNKCDKNKM